MIDEINVLGVYVPAALACGVVAAMLVYSLRTLLQRLPAYRLLWHPSLLELALFVLFWWGLSALADAFL
ncbi:MAG TPA: DUF1656 domain-containing protein [Sphingobium sp.]|uniref:DUF1656 domain-containing protein n=1 Tax=Sphingobium sp. TaxID=1912891 RepID=UPI002ED48C70